jgi:hypothetical protein
MTTQQNEQQVSGEPGGQTGAFSEQAGAGILGGTEQNEQQVDGGGHGGQTGAFSEQAAPVHEPPVVVEPLHSEEPSYEAASHAAGAEDPSGLAGHDGGTDAGQEVHHV